MSALGITILDLSAYFGLAALGAVVLNMFLGILMAFRYSPVRQWPHRHFNYFGLHNWSGYIALSLAAVHPLLLLLNKAPKFRLLDIAYPVNSPSQPLENTLGAVALYMIAVIVVTSYFRIRLGRRLWRSFHLTIYIAAVAIFWHCLFTDPNLKNAPDWLDGGKIFVELCVAAIVIVAFLRWRHSRKSSPRAAASVR